MAAQHAFKSQRLIYKAVEDTDDDFIYARSSDYLAVANAYPGLLMPASKKTVNDVKKYYESCLLAVIICLPPPDDSAADGADGDKKTEKAKPIPIGNITLASSPPHLLHHRRSTIGIGLLPEYQGKGYGSEAIEWVLEWGFQRAALHRISIGGFEWNKRALDLYERLGFKPEARQRDFFWFEGRWWDSIELAMLEDEWRARRDKRLEEEKAKGGK